MFLFFSQLVSVAYLPKTNLTTVELQLSNFVPTDANVFHLSDTGCTPPSMQKPFCRLITHFVFSVSSIIRFSSIVWNYPHIFGILCLRIHFLLTNLGRNVRCFTRYSVRFLSFFVHLFIVRVNLCKVAVVRKSKK